MKIRLDGMRRAVCPAIALLALPACAQLGAKSRIDPATIAVYPGGEDRIARDSSREADKESPDKCGLLRGMGSYSRGAIDLDCFRFPEDRDEPVSSAGTKLLCEPAARGSVAEFACVSIAKTRDEIVRLDRSYLAYSKAAKHRPERNRLTALLLKHSDDVCTREMGMLTSNQATMNASLSILATAATTTANIVSGEQAKSILTGIGTLSGATRSHMNAEVYRNTVAYAISRAIALERKRLRDGIEARYTQDNAAFTVDDAIRAANEYHGVCSFYKGLELVLASVEGDPRTRDAQARRAQIEELEERIRKYREQRDALKAEPGTAASPDIAVYDTSIKELIGRIQQLTLASVPAQNVPVQNVEKTQDGQKEADGAAKKGTAAEEESPSPAASKDKPAPAAGNG